MSLLAAGSLGISMFGFAGLLLVGSIALAIVGGSGFD
jgi:hypothetical protein